MSFDGDPRDDSRDGLISGCLRKAVAQAFKADRDQVTLRKIRALVEEELQLGERFFKSDPYWKAQSEDIIVQEVAIQVENTLNSVESKELPLPEKKKRSRKPASKLATKAPEVQDEKLPNLKPGPRKRGRPAKTNAGKTSTLQGSNESPPKSVKPARGNDTDEAPTLDVPRRNSSVVKNDSESELSDLSDVPHKRSRKGQVKQAKEKDSDINAVIPTDKGPTNTDLVPAPVWDAAGNVSGAESEMSIVLDEPPEKKKKGRPRSSTGDSTAKKPAKKPAGPAKVRKQKESPKDLTPDEEKIKSLQGWLLKCGVRKIWSRELSKFETPKEKIQHLKNILVDIGMVGQYSMAKAKRIKEERELAAEVAWVQQGASDWGKESDGKLTRAGRSTATSIVDSKKPSRGFDDLDFLGDQSDSDA